ncbi:fatty acyl-CoA reductase 1 [Caerostris darwini]|uniref:Fatty acyl-CoA reductase n=1 Tax=Caerostris darwini TaxID=1538125 RepID=A0AAV4WT38_9ARAC|nr:fatty acyl-CoA reductase 1 [Caerostris darwini]
MVVLLEILLRCCGGIKSIYILLREKKGVSPQARKEEIFKRSVFRQLREEDPKVFDKVHVVAGDLSLTDMDMSQEDLKRVVEEVTIVFHCATSISFFKPLQYLLLHNAGGVNNIISLCKKLKRCEVLVYTSTAYSNCNRELKIEDKVYRLPYEAQRFIDAVGNGKEELLQQIASECQPRWPNHYSFSKCIAENLPIKKASEIQTAIIQPSPIGPIWKGALPGYVEENSRLAQLLIASSVAFRCELFVPLILRVQDRRTDPRRHRNQHEKYDSS